MRRIRTRGILPCPAPGPSGGQAPALHSSLPATNEDELEEVSLPTIFVAIDVSITSRSASSPILVESTTCRPSPRRKWSLVGAVALRNGNRRYGI